MKTPPLVSIVVITINTPELTAACLRSVFRNTTVPFEVLVINNSRAAAIRKCLKRFPRIRVIRNPRNFGFARAANQGALVSRGRYVCFLNSDTLVPPRWMERLLDAARQPGVGAVGPTSQEGHGYLYHWPPPNFKADQETTNLVDLAFQKTGRGRLESVPYLYGFCLLIPKVVMARVGLFDEQYFFGVEDNDYCLRLRRAGYRLVRVHSLFVHHQRGGSSDPKKRSRYIQNAEKHFFKKWRSVLPGAPKDYRAAYWAATRPLHRLLRRWKTLPTPCPLKHLRSHISIRTGNRRLFLRLSDLELFEPRGNVPVPFLLREGLLTPPWSRAPRRIDVTILMAAHNAEIWIGEAIESVLSQPFRNFELIVADDGSCDRTAEIIARYLRHPQIRLLRNETQQGIAATRNRILALARGRYIAVCDADDVMLPSLLPRFVKILDSQPRTGWVYSDRLLIDGRGFPLGIDAAAAPDGKTEFRRNVIAHAGSMIRRTEIEKAGGYDETLLTSEDYDLALKIGRRARILALPGEIHYLWRRYPDSHSSLCPWARPDTERILKALSP